jgi:hypothetical protein
MDIKFLTKNDLSRDYKGLHVFFLGRANIELESNCIVEEEISCLGYEPNSLI